MEGNEDLIQIDGSGFSFTCNKCGSTEQPDIDYSCARGSSWTGVYAEEITLSCKQCDNTLEIDVS